MLNVTRNLKALMQYHGVKNVTLANAIGVDKSTISRWFASNSDPRSETINKIADIFDIPISLLYEDEDSFDKMLEKTHKPIFDKEERAKRNNARMESFVDNFVDSIAQEVIGYDEPIYEVSAGHGRLNESYEVDDAVKADREYSKVRICGNSMHPVLHDGDLVRVRHTKEVSPSDLTIIQINGDEAMCKYVELKEDGIWLRAENKAVYEDNFYNAMEVITLPITIIGVAEELVSRKL